MTRLLREPLLHFLVLGAALFGLFSYAGKKEEAPQRIAVSRAQIENLASRFALTWQRPPNPEEMHALIEDYVRDEIFYREAKAAGLDRDDLVIRRRLRQKMEFFAEDTGISEPSDEQLAAYLASHPERFRSEDRLTFRQVFLSASREQNSLQSEAKDIVATLGRAGADLNPTTLGDDFLLGADFSAMPLSDIARSFGEGFAERLSAIAPGRWQGPISSGYGLHFVFVSEHLNGISLPLDAVRQAVRSEWVNARRLEARERLYRDLRQRYEVVAETPPAKRTARAEPSGAVQ
ncbi:PPIC-type PPIASE domain-containing protein [Rhizobiales bacterium GAS113]|nr:PPIC-type PPIASE domain-containing protein [Rhizobiales bacterium GAS113]